MTTPAAAPTPPADAELAHASASLDRLVATLRTVLFGQEELIELVVTGALGPDSNAHGPNEYLDVPTARKITLCVAHLLYAHATR